MSRALVPRMLVAGSAVSAATSVRIGARCAVLIAQRAPALLRLGVQGTAGPQPALAQATFRDELLGLARESAELSWRQMRRGLQELDLLTRSDERTATPSRPHRVKA